MPSWKRTFASAFIAQVLSIVGFSFALPFLPFFIEELGIVDKAEQAKWAGIVMGSTGAALALFAPIWGSLADRFGRKLMVMRAMFAGTVVMLLMSIVQNVGQLVACRILQGILTGTVGASIALVASVVPSTRSGFALGMMQTALFLGVAIGPLVGGQVIDAFGYRTAFRFGAVILMLGGLLVCLGTREDFSHPDPGERNRTSLKTIMASPAMLIAVLVLFSIRFSNTSSNPSFPLIIKDILGEKDQLGATTGKIFFSAALAGAVSSAILGHFGDRWGHRRILLTCSACAAVVSVMHFFADTIGKLMFARMCFGFCVAGMIPAANAMIRHNIDDRHIGRAYGGATALSTVGMAVGPLIGGWVAAHYGLRVPFLLTACGQVVVFVVVALLVRDHMIRPKEGA